MDEIKTVTVDQVLEWKPCDGYDRVRLEELFAGREVVSALDILNMPISADDKLWAALRIDLIEENSLHLLACDFAEVVLPLWEEKYPDDDRPRAVIEAKRAWVASEISDRELDAAWAAALDAVMGARDAARDAAWIAARDAAGIPAWIVAEDAAGIAAWVAVRDAQVKMIRARLEDGNRVNVVF